MPFGFYFLKPKKDLLTVVDWLKAQSHYEDAIIYLIQKEIYENGIRDLSYSIPRMRNDSYFEELFFKNKDRDKYERNQQYIKPLIQDEVKPQLKVVSLNEIATKEPQYDKFSQNLNSIQLSEQNQIDLACYDD